MPDSVWAAIAVAVSTAFGSVLTFFGVRRADDHKSQHEAESARREAEAVDDARWQAMLMAQREGFNSLLTPLREEVGTLRGQVDELRSEVTKLRGEVEHRDVIIGAFASHARVLHAGWPPPTMPPTPPDTIAHLI